MNLPEAFTPKIVTTFREGYGAAELRADAIAGLTVAIVALPLAMALGIASGASPREGLVTAVEAEGVSETAGAEGGAGVGVEGVGFADRVGEEERFLAELDGDAGAGPGDLFVLLRRG